MMNDDNDDDDDEKNDDDDDVEHGRHDTAKQSSKHDILAIVLTIFWGSSVAH